MPLPDYRASLVNLMASIGAALGAPMPHPPLAFLPSDELAAARRLVLLVVDGLGYDYLASRSGALREHLRGRLTSVFPSTTASAIPAFLTGLAPRQHGLTGWHMYCRELGAIVTTLPFLLRAGRQPLSSAGITPQRLYGLTPLADRLRVPVHVVSPQAIVHSDFNKALSGRARRHGYTGLLEMFGVLLELAHGDEPAAYIQAYWPELDSLAHAHGSGSPQVAAAFAALDAACGRFLEAARGSGTTLIVTADHGFIDTSPADIIDLDDHPELRQTLLLPLCGEPRVAYAYVRAGQEQRFETYVRQRLVGKVDLYRSADLIDQGWFGPGHSHPALAGRVGDYTLVAKDNHVLRDWLAGEERHMHVGMHGGLSEAEMWVPLIVARTR